MAAAEGHTVIVELLVRVRTLDSDRTTSVHITSLHHTDKDPEQTLFISVTVVKRAPDKTTV